TSSGRSRAGTKHRTPFASASRTRPCASKPSTPDSRACSARSRTRSRRSASDRGASDVRGETPGLMEGSATHLPTVKQLRYFVALAEHRHFGRAAAACHVSQSAFSVAIRELESLLGANLVDRTNRKVTITATGREVAARAKRCLRDLTALAEAARREDRPLEGPLHLGVIPTIAPFLLPRVLPAVRKAYPALKLFLHEDVTDRLHEQLMDGALDIVLLALPYDLPGIERMVLFRDRFRLAVRKGTRLVDPRHYRPDRLPDGSVLLLREGHCLREHAIDACRIRDTEKMSAFSASSLLTLIEMVDAD